MKTIITSIVLAITLGIFPTEKTIAQTEGGTTITVTVPVSVSEGTILATLQTEETFMQKGIQSKMGTIENGKAVMTFTGVQPGTYAILLFHDKNNNNQMDFEINGMPKEPYGVSNNAMSYGPPAWNEAKFEVKNEPIEMEIRM
ncbi:DUF2141 domain-containing protein [Aequorivita echinoideorum]|uniref:DUF2141 domain-containing protein n=1 Tax=Aequorivita echinoideorum TaxID=1549647 RepID=A0ABS5S5B5_9FLAO|nr:DUF2141 domain-containing protein [Aequorivita echinoideorum]MBT0608396.1 DUF2141 domain-containing protein [Aequorivita echinoideorum]